MANFRIDGLTLSYVNVRDHDRFVTVLSPQIGLADIYARGVRRPTSLLQGRTDPFISGTFLGYERNDRYYLDQVDVRYRFVKLTSDPTSLAAASHLTEVIRDSASDPSMAEILYPMAHHALYAFEMHPSEWQKIIIATNLYILDHLGFAPDTLTCGQCGAALNHEITRYNHREGRFICRKHAQRIDEWTGQPQYETYPYALRQTLSFIHRSNAQSYLSFTLDSSVLQALWYYMKRELTARLEREWPRLNYLETLMRPSNDLEDLVKGLKDKRKKLIPEAIASVPEDPGASQVPSDLAIDSDNPADANAHHKE